MNVVILGCGYTGRYVASRLTAKGINVIATSRAPERLGDLPVSAERFDTLSSTDLSFVPQGATILYSIPPSDADKTQEIVEALGDRPSRVVYLSTTGVYGTATEVDETTQPHPQDSAGLLRVKTETAIASGTWTTLILRPAAIYGPDRGVHVRIQRGDYSLVGDGSSFVSRIHVEDLCNSRGKSPDFGLGRSLSRRGRASLHSSRDRAVLFRSATRSNAAFHFIVGGTHNPTGEPAC